MKVYKDNVTRTLDENTQKIYNDLCELILDDKYLNFLNNKTQKEGIQTKTKEKLDIFNKKILELKNDITKLVSLGNDLIKNSETSVCPLCNHNYEQHDELLKRVLENSNDMFEVSLIENQLEIEKQNYETQEKYFIQKESK